MIEVLKPGPLSALQDLGRAGFQRFGVIASGAMDEWSHRVANLLVGNAEDEASLEITLMGPSLLFHQDALIAIVGADLSPRIGEQAVPIAWPFKVSAGSRLDFGGRRFGCRAYLAVRGGFAVPPVMQSRSTYLRAGFGGFEGRALRKGDRLPVGAALADARLSPPPRPPADFPSLAHPGAHRAALRVVPGQQWAAFDDQARQLLLSEAFSVNRNSDRMGYRLEGPVLKLSQPLEMISEAVAFGTVQVPPDGQPIVLMADRQTTGGYPKIANVISVDLPRLAQAVPGDSLRFALCTLEEARLLDNRREAQLAQLQSLIDPLLETG